MERQSIGIMHLPNQRYKFFCKKGIHYNILVIGASGTGKTTFINKLFNEDLLLSSYDNDEQFEIEHRKQTEPYNLIDSTFDPSHFNSNINFQSTDIHFVDKKFNIMLNVTEIDNIGDQIDNTEAVGPVKAFINDQFKKYYDDEKQNVRSLIKDKRIHVCLYFLDSVSEPMRLIDIEMMKELSKIVNVIPVIGRADILSINELHNFKEEINRIIDENNIRVYYTPYHFDESQLYKAPYGISTNRINGYNWKIKESTENQFNDLKKILVDFCMIDLVEKTELFYEAFRTRELTSNYGNADFSDEEVAISREFIDQIRNDENKIEIAKEAFTKRKREIEEMLNARKEQVSVNNK